jgi:TonB family protein
MNYHGWRCALDGRRVLFREDVVLDLRMLAIEGFTALRRRGLEVGGILVGDTGGGEPRVNGFQESPCEHRYGPSYVLSEGDREKLTELLALRQIGAPPLVGFYRSVTGREPGIEESDETLVAEYLPSGDGVFLLLRPLSAERCVATFRLFRDGRFVEAPDEPEFSFEPTALPVTQPVPGEAGAKPAGDPEPAPEPELASEPEPASDAQPAREEIAPPPVLVAGAAASRRPTWWMTALACLAGTVAGASIFELGWSQNRGQPAPPRFAELNLDARPDGRNLLVSWDGAVAKSLQATRGALTIADGDAHREVELGSAEVQAGKYAYPVEHPEIAARLTLSANGHTVASEAVRLAPARAVAAPAATPTAAAAAAAVPAPTAPDAASPAAAAESDQTAVPPEVVHRVQPTIPAGIRSRIEGRIVIPVEVRVSDRGKVLRARVAEARGDGVYRYLAEKAEKAARWWQFKPARSRNGAAIASNRTISFVFTP